MVYICIFADSEEYPVFELDAPMTDENIKKIIQFIHEIQEEK